MLRGIAAQGEAGAQGGAPFGAGAGTGPGAAGARAGAVALLRGLGAATVLLRMPLPPLAATPGEELGLALPEFQDVPLGPCVVRTRRDGSLEVLVAAPTVEGALRVASADAGKAALRAAAFVEVSDEPFLLRAVEVMEVYGRAYLYRVLLRAADAEVRGWR